MISSIGTIGINGINGSLVQVETYISNGLPAFDIVGLPDTAVKEARERVRAAAKTSGMRFPTGRITVNLAPANLKKTGTHYDLPILIGILSACGTVKHPPHGTAFLGELGLNGDIRPINGVLPMAIAAKNAGIETLYVPAQNAAEATLSRGPAIIPVNSVKEVISALNGEIEIPEEIIWVPESRPSVELDFKDVLGQETAKRALEIAAAGGHNVLLIGPPGSGKSMLSKRLPSILPDMTWQESLEVTQIYSVLGMLKPDEPLVMQRPFRSPHHTISNMGLAGGGVNPKPGEISMAHKGVLFLDELPEFKKDTLELMRQPLEDAQITISRVSGTVTYPPEIMLVCAMNPSAAIKERVDAARKIQNERYGVESGLCNARMGSHELRTYCNLDREAVELMRKAFDVYGLTARSYDKILRVARTVADMEGSPYVTADHIAEAIQYRTVNI